MRDFFILLLGFFISFCGLAQTYEVGVSLGTTNFVGDIGNTTYIRPTDIGFGVIGKWNRSKRHSFRFSALYLPISGNDSESDDVRKQQRGFEFENSIKEFSLGLEYTFWEWDLHSGKKQGTPYLYTGVTAINYGALARTPAPENDFRAYADPWSFAIPMILGVKSNLGRNMVISFEVGARYTFTDNLDGSNPEDLGLPVENNLSFGNLNTNDWYFFSAVSLTYAFGRKPCYCIF